MVTNCDVTSDLPSPLVAKTTSGRNLDNHKMLKNSQTVGDRWVLHRGQKEPCWIGQSDGYTISARWLHLAPISASDPFLQHENALITRKRGEVHVEYLQNTNSKPGSAYPMEMLFPIGSATQWRLLLLVLTTVEKLITRCIACASDELHS
jgi:hypothetical protein